jgi:hypothetical protein
MYWVFDPGAMGRLAAVFTRHVYVVSGGKVDPGMPSCRSRSRMKGK